VSQSLTIERSFADVVIIGGGVIGLTIARALAKQGAGDITVLEKNQFGREASWAAGGILAPQVEADASDDFFRLACRSRDMYRDFAADLQAESGIDVELDPTGTLFVAFTEAEEAEFRSRYHWQQSEGLAVEWLKGDEVRRIEPAISPNARCALRFPNDFQVDNRRLIEALIVANRQLGVHLIDNCETGNLQITAGKVGGVVTASGFMGAGKVLIAAGAWSSLINSAELAPVEPVRGQMLCFAAPGFARHVIYSSRGYLIPRHDGRLLAGSTTERVGFDQRVTDDGIETIRSMALQIAPALASRPLTDSWAGLRPRASDGLPVLGAAQDVKGLFYATGHYRNGILLAPITGKLMADAILSGKTSPSIESFSPQRLSLKTNADSRQPPRAQSQSGSRG
jgi:glycine oxidase